VTGASRGIGKSISVALSGAGVKVILSARTVEKLEEVKKEIEEKGGQAEVMPLDLSGTENIINLFKDITDRFNRLDILVNNAAIGIFGDIIDASQDDLDRILDINFKSMFTSCQQFFKLMIPQKSGYIINISSIMGVKAYKQQSIYAASKHAVMGLTKALAVEGQEHNIRVSAILPGGVDTEFISGARPDLDRSVLIKPDDIAHTVLYLLSLSNTAVVDQVILRRFTSTPFNA
jgi:3-oxoacyl-[acyl-carrier protein] reductase